MPKSDPHEFRFRLSVSIPIVTEVCCERLLKALVFFRLLRVSPQIVSKLDVVAKGFASLHNHIEMVRSSVGRTIECFPAANTLIAKMLVSEFAKTADGLPSVGG